jgi:hypothetical protein
MRWLQGECDSEKRNWFLYLRVENIHHYFGVWGLQGYPLCEVEPLSLN